MADAVTYRPNVAAIVRAKDGRILICERADIPGAWQFPQGGIHPGEGAEDALRRELVEELNLHPEHYSISDRRGPYRYAFAPGRLKDGFGGQEQVYFMVDFCGEDGAISVETLDPEFRSVRWIFPQEFRPEWLLPAKRAVYRQVLFDFFNVVSD